MKSVSMAPSRHARGHFLHFLLTLAPLPLVALYLLSSGPVLACHYSGKIGDPRPLYRPIFQAGDACPTFANVMDWYVNLFSWPPSHGF
jgi:hypothetical protein